MASARFLVRAAITVRPAKGTQNSLRFFNTTLGHVGARGGDMPPLVEYILCALFGATRARTEGQTLTTCRA